MTSGRTRVAAALLLAAVLIAAPHAHADGDPASDYLISQEVFFSFTELPAASKATLTRVVGEANRRGYTVRVALIGDRTDLGAVPVFWRRPQPYAKFLSQELLGPAPYTDRVLVVMPNGFGLARSGNELPAERRALDAVAAPQARGDDIAAGAVRAVEQLAALHGIRLGAGGSGWSGARLALLVAVVAAVACAAAAAVLLRRRRRSA